MENQLENMLTRTATSRVFSSRLRPPAVKSRNMNSKAISAPTMGLLLQSAACGVVAFVQSPPIARPCLGGYQRGVGSSSPRGLSMMSSTGSSPSALVLDDSERAKNNMFNDGFFYSIPRICYHVDQGFLGHLTQLYRERIPAGGVVLDIMSSWVSHLPPEVSYERVDGQGMNQIELDRNVRLSEKKVWDLNADPRLPFEDATYDAVTCAVSVQYLQQPEKVFADVRRVLKPGGVAIFSFSNRMFYDKAISAWVNRSGKQRLRLVTSYFDAAGGFGRPETVEYAGQPGGGFFAGMAQIVGFSGNGDPFLAVVATKNAE